MLDYPQVWPCLPIKKELGKVPRQWIINVCYTKVGDVFGQWVAENIEERNEKVASDRDLLIDMDPEVYKAFQTSTAVSCKYSANFK